MNLTLRKVFLETAISIREKKPGKEEKLQAVQIIQGELRIASQLLESIAERRIAPSHILLKTQKKIEELKEKANKIKKRLI